MKKWVIACFLIIQTMSAHAVDISVGQGSVEAKPVAVVPFAGGGKEKVDFIISSNLKQSGFFSPINPSSYSARPHSSKQVDYNVFKSAGAAIVVSGQIGSGKINFFIADSFQQQIIGEYTVSLANKTLRQGVHEVSDIILEKLTGTRGAFASRLVYVNEIGSGASRTYHLMLSDSDGAHPVQLLSSRAPIMSPRFSPKGTAIAYVTFEGAHAQIVTHDIKTGRRGLLVKEKGINSSPAWSNDGSKIAMVLSRDGNAEIYYRDLRTNSLVRVTNNKAIDSEPTWAPNNKEIYFTSDRSGSPQVYKVNISSGSVAKITRSGSYNSGADVSFDGKKIAVGRNKGGKFIIGTIDKSTNNFSAVSNGALDETPRFSPNGKMLIFTAQENNRNVLKIVNIDGGATKTLSASGQIRDADWSTFL